MKKYLLSLSIGLCLTTMFCWAQPPKQRSLFQSPSKDITFEVIELSGCGRAIIKPGPNQLRVSRGYPLSLVKSQPSKNKWVIASKPPSKGQCPKLEVHAVALKKIVVRGPLQVDVQGFRHQKISLDSRGTGKINLKGGYAPVNITQRGKSEVSIRWVSADTVEVSNSGFSILTLAGRADKMYINLRDHAVLNAQYLRANTIQIKTRGHSVAHVMPLDTLRAFATDTSNIYYYHSTQHITQHSERSGNVLQAGWRP